MKLGLTLLAGRVVPESPLLQGGVSFLEEAPVSLLIEAKAFGNYFGDVS